MLGFYPIAGAPLADGQWSDEVTLASQTLNFSQNSVLISDDDVIEVAGQVLLTTLNGVVTTADANITLASQTLLTTLNSVQAEVQPPVFDSQTISTTLNGVALSTGVNLTASSQTLLFTENSVSLSTDHTIPLTAETPLGTTLRSVAASGAAGVFAASQSLTLTENSVTTSAAVVLEAASQTIYTTLNDLRLWQSIATAQPGTCPDHCDGLWTEIPFDTLVYGDDHAIATTPLCSLPQPLPPIRKYPGAEWSGMATQTTTTWSNTQT